jgi:predicted transcriptional regulator
MQEAASNRMEEDIERLLAETLYDVVRLNVALFFHDHPSLIESGEQIARRLGRDLAAVGRALEGLAQSGILERFELGSGRYVLYAYAQNPKTRDTIARLSRCFREDPVLRGMIVRQVMGLRSKG